MCVCSTTKKEFAAAGGCHEAIIASYARSCVSQQNWLRNTIDPNARARASPAISCDNKVSPRRALAFAWNYFICGIPCSHIIGESVAFAGCEPKRHFTRGVAALLFKLNRKNLFLWKAICIGAGHRSVERENISYIISLSRSGSIFKPKWINHFTFRCAVDFPLVHRERWGIWFVACAIALGASRRSNPHRILMLPKYMFLSRFYSFYIVSVNLMKRCALVVRCAWACAEKSWWDTICAGVARASVPLFSPSCSFNLWRIVDSYNILFS